MSAAPIVTIGGIPEVGVLATDLPGELVFLDADVALHNAPREGYDEILPLLESGKNVTTVVGGNNTLDTPFHEAIVAACKKGGVSFMGAGSIPVWPQTSYPWWPRHSARPSTMFMCMPAETLRASLLFNWR